MILGPNLLQVLDQIVVFAILKTMQSQSKTTRIQRNLASSHEKGYCWIVIRNQKLSDGTHSYSTILKMLSFFVSTAFNGYFSTLCFIWGLHICKVYPVQQPTSISSDVLQGESVFVIFLEWTAKANSDVMGQKFGVSFFFAFAFARIRTPKTGVNGRSCLTIGSEIQNLIEKIILKFRF